MAHKIINLGPDSTWGNYGKDLLSNIEHSIYRTEGSYSSDDEGSNTKFSYKSYTGTDADGNATYEDLASIAEISKITKVKITEDSGEVSYKEGLTPYNGELNVAVRVKITPNAKLVEKFPTAHVFIDGKEYDLGVLGTADSPNAIDFVMSSSHRVKIQWAKNIAESFRIKPQVL